MTSMPVLKNAKLEGEAFALSVDPCCSSYSKERIANSSSALETEGGPQISAGSCLVFRETKGRHLNNCFCY